MGALGRPNQQHITHLYLINLITVLYVICYVSHKCYGFLGHTPILRHPESIGDPEADRKEFDQAIQSLNYVYRVYIYTVYIIYISTQMYIHMYM